MTPVILFDGVCNLCNASVQFVIKRDVKQKFRFASLQSDFAKNVLLQHHISDEIRTIVLLTNNRIYLRSNAVLEISRELNGLWSLIYIFKIIPRFFRDGVYNFISKNRYQWFGRIDTCWLPTPDLKSRFLD
jgi:predicted DCC family thiol-disulfide oxidoreductase YuxK